MTISSLCVVEKFASQKPAAYVAIASGHSFEVYSGIIDHETKPLQLVCRVPDVQADAIQSLQLLFDSAREELYLITSAKLDHRLNVWRVP